MPGNLIVGAAYAVVILFAVPLGWVCMKKLGAHKPWAAEISAFLATLPVSMVILVIGGLYSYSQRLDSGLAALILGLTYATGALLGGILFSLIGRASSHSSRHDL